MRPPIRANCWLYVVSSIALVMSVVSSPIRIPQRPSARIAADLLRRDCARLFDGIEAAVVPNTPDRAVIDSAGLDFDETEEDESFWSYSHIVRLPSDLSAFPPKRLIDPRPGCSPPRTASIPMRC